MQFDFDDISKELTSKSLLLVEGEVGVPVDELIIRSNSTQGQVRLSFTVVVLNFPCPHLPLFPFSLEHSCSL